MTAPRTLRLDLEYEGTDFVGWQSQSRGRTVQGELQRALRRLLQEEVTPVGAGRTDAGTHALGQVAHVHTASPMATRRLGLGINALLPPDVAVTAVRDVAADFHARYSARGKRYRYRISPVRTALTRRQVWTLYRDLDLEAMQDAARSLVGAHGFRAFCKASPPPDHYECQVTAAAWQRQGDELVFEIEANRFLRHMVRVLVGTLAEVGEGRRRPADFEGLLGAAAERDDAGPTAPARGLCMLWIRYDEADGGVSGRGTA